MPRLAAVPPGPAAPAWRPVPVLPTRSSADCLDGLALEPPALALRQPAPDTEALVVLKGVLQALGPDLAAAADLFASRVEPPFSGKNASGSVCAQSARSCQLSSLGIVSVNAEPVVHQRDDDVSHSAPPAPSRNPVGSRFPRARELH